MPVAQTKLPAEFRKSTPTPTKPPPFAANLARRCSISGISACIAEDGGRRRKLLGWGRGVAVSRAGQEPRRGGEKRNDGHTEYGKCAGDGGKQWKGEIPGGGGDGYGA